MTAPSTASRRSRRAATLVAAGILLSRLSGLARERVLARYLGVGVAVDAFRAAVRIPNLLQNLLGEGVLSASFIPVYSRLLGEGRDEEAGRVAGAVAGLLSAVAGALVLVGVVFARPLTVALTPGFTGERLDLTVTLMRILTPGVGILVLSAWALGVLNSHRRFFLSYVAPVLWNGAQIAAVITAAAAGVGETDLAVALAWGAFAGGFLQLAVQLPGLVRVAGWVRPSLRTDLAPVRAVLRRFVPVVAGRGVVQLSAYVDLLLASLLAVGAVSALGFAQVFYLLPISLFGMSVAAAELPELSRMDAGQARDLLDRLGDGLARIAFFVVPTTLAYVIFGDLVIGVVLGTGEFGATETRLVWLVLLAYSVGLLATTASRLLQNALYALGDARGPAVIAAVRVAVAAALGAALMFQLDRVAVVGTDLVGLDRLPAPVEPLPVGVRTDPDALRLGAAGLALAAGLTAWLELELLRRRLRRTVGAVRLGGGHLLAIAAATGAAAVVGLPLRALTDHLPPAAALLLAGLPAAAAYLAAARALGVPEATALLRLPRRAKEDQPPAG